MFNLFVKIFLFLQLLQSIDSFDQSIDLNNDDHHRNDLFQMKSFWIKSMIDSDDKIFALESNSIQDNRIDKNVWKYHNQMDSYASFDLPKLINRFRLISLKPLLIEEDFQPKFNFDKSFIRNLEQSRWIRIKNGQIFVLINNQMLPIETVLESIQRNNRQQYRSQSFLMNREDYSDRFDSRFNDLDRPIISSSMITLTPPNQKLPIRSRRFRLSTLDDIGFGRLFN